MTSYSQFCPVAKAMELLDERWTLLVVREMLAGSRHFNDIRRGVPRMSPALLSKRLRRLTQAGLVERRDHGGRTSYVLTPAGEELRPAVEALGQWGARWVPELGDEDLDPHLLLWDMHRSLDTANMPDERTTLGFHFTDVVPAAARWWLVVDRDAVDVCDVDPGHPVTLVVRTSLRTLVDLWRGEITWTDASDRGLTVDGPPWADHALPRWLKLSPFAAVPRPRPGNGQTLPLSASPAGAGARR